MTHRRLALAAAVCLLGCDQPFVTGGGPVGVGLTAGFGVAQEHCDDSLVNNTCHDDKLALRSARATNSRASVVEVGEESARFRAESAGEATGVIETVSDGTFDLSFEVRAIEVERLELVDTSLDTLYPNDAIAFLTGSQPHFRHVTQYFTGYSMQELRGDAEFSVDARGTEASMIDASFIAMLATGSLPGTVTLHASTGLEHTFDIVDPDRIVELQLFDVLRPVTSVKLEDYGTRVRIVPFLDDGRPIAGCGTHRPEITVSSPIVRAEIGNLSYCFLDLDRDAPGDATVTISWGGATTTLDVKDVPAR